MYQMSCGRWSHCWARPPPVDRSTISAANTEVTIRELAEQIVDRADSTSSIRYLPYEQAYSAGFEDMRRRVPDISKIGAAIGWTPTHLLPKILDDMIAYERERLT